MKDISINHETGISLSGMHYNNGKEYIIELSTQNRAISIYLTPEELKLLRRAIKPDKPKKIKSIQDILAKCPCKFEIKYYND